jgi:hypothetical protein
MARKTHTAPILTVHRGGADPMDQPRTTEEVEQAQRDAHDALMRMSLVLPDSDPLRRPAVLLARSIRMRQSRARVEQPRASGRGGVTEPDRQP